MDDNDEVPDIPRSRSDSEDEGYDEGAGDRISPDQPLPEDETEQPRPTSGGGRHHLPPDIPPDAPEEPKS